ncbi:hypothetical protein BDN72DRAFT_915034, partial [Pluteus cervinus]
MNFNHNAQLFATNSHFENTINHIHMLQSDKSGSEMLAEVLQKLPALDYLKIHEEALRRTDQDSGKWYLDSMEFQSWCNGSMEVKGILALGDPGVGKTCLTSLVIQHLKRLDRPVKVAYIYVQLEGVKLHSLTNIVLTLLKQILKTYDSLPEYASSFYKQFKLGEDLPIEVLTTTLLGACNDKHTPIYIVFDALDEFKHSHQGELVTLIKQLLAAGAWVFATCRQAYRSIEGLFDPEHCLKHIIRANASDINNFLKKRLEGNVLLKSILDDQFQNMIISTIVSNSQEVFLIAAMQFEYISSLTTKEKITIAISQIPSDLDAHFDLTLKRISEQRSDLVELAKMVLMWLLHACRPLTATELCHAVGIQVGSNKFSVQGLTSPTMIIQACLGFVTLQKEGDSD